MSKIVDWLKQTKRKFKIKKIILQKTNTIIIHPDSLQFIKLNIIGQNNIVKIGKINAASNALIIINICGNNNNIDIGDISLSMKLSVQLGQLHENFGPIHDSKFIIKDDTSIESLDYITYNSFAKCIIGEQCMISYNIVLYNSDAHAILEYGSNKLVNYVDGIYIGEHCWVGKDVTIMKNTYIPNDCIIGANSLVSGKLENEHAMYAGNPAKLVRTNRTWNPNGNKCGYIDNLELKCK